jgi:hypothetical protein
MEPRRAVIEAGLGLVVLIGGLAAIPVASTQDAVASFQGVAVNMSDLGRGRAGTIAIAIERWTTDEEREKLASVLVEKNETALLAELQKIKPRVGFIRTPDSVGYDLRYAREIVNADGRRRIVIATDRPVSWIEKREKGRPMDYPFMLVEMRLDTKGKGTGKLASMVKVNYDREKKTLGLENWTSEPVILTEITETTTKAAGN